MLGLIYIAVRALLHVDEAKDVWVVVVAGKGLWSLLNPMGKGSEVC